MDDRTSAFAPVAASNIPVKPPDSKLFRRFPTIAHLRAHARRHVPHFAFEYMDGGAGSDGGIRRNWDALDAIELMPRYGVTPTLPPVEVELFGRRYAAPVGIAPMGGPSTVWPGADAHLAEAAQRLRVPYVMSTVAGITIERAAELAPDVFWFQLYRFANNNHAVGYDLVRRAHEAGAQVLMLTLDVPVRTTRAREVAVGITNPFRINASMVLGTLLSPGYARAFLTHGIPRFVNFAPYAGGKTGPEDIARFIRSEQRGAFTWEEVARYRDRWHRPLVVKGVLHPADAEKAVALGVDGVVVSNHGGRQVEALPAPIDVLPAVADAVNNRTTVMMDSGIRSGLDVVRAIALGAHAAFAGKAFLWGLGALGPQGPGLVIDLLIDEMRAALGQIGAASLADAQAVERRHPGAWSY